MKPELVQKARNLMARASVIAERKSSNPDKGHAGKPQSSPPTGYAETTVQEIHALFARCETDADLEDALLDAEKELESIQRTPPAANEDAIDRKYRLLREGEGKDAVEVAKWEGCSVKEIWALRRENHRKPRDGRSFPKMRSDFYATADQRVALVARIHWEEPDLSKREIALRLRISHTQVKRDLEAAEANKAA